MNGVVPVPVKVVTFQIDLSHLFIADGDAFGVGALVDFGSDAQPGCRRRADETDDRGQTRQRFAAPVHGDVAEEPMFDLVPFAGAGRVVTHGDGEAGAVGKLLQLGLPQARLRPVAPSASAVISS